MNAYDKARRAYCVLSNKDESGHSHRPLRIARKRMRKAGRRAKWKAS